MVPNAHPNRIEQGLCRYGLTLPPPIRMDSPGSFAHYTWTSRWRSVVHGVCADPRYGSATRQRLEALLTEMYGGTVLPCPDTYGEDLSTWTADLVPYCDRPWQDMPWFFAEVYFYRRLLAATHYFHPGTDFHRDPFEPSKSASLMEHQSAMRAIAAELTTSKAQTLTNSLRFGWSRMLWGNQADLSLRPGERLNIATFGAGQAERLLVDETDGAIARLQARQPAHRIDLVADNAGLELLSDLAWIDTLLTEGQAETVFLHLKCHPTFVSDATPADLQFVLQTLIADVEPASQQLGQRLQSAIATQTLQVQADPFWTAPRAFWEMPDLLYEDLATSNLLVFKGDANYRRILGDRQWESTTPFTAIAHYLPAPTLALRTLKSELVVGLEPGQAEATVQQDPNWQTNGQWSVIQYLDVEPRIASQCLTC